MKQLRCYSLILLMSFLCFSIYTAINFDSLELLHEAILNDSSDEIQKAIQAGANINIGKNGKAPILWAVILKKFIAVEQLLKHGAKVDVSYEGKTLVQYAIRCGDVKSATLLVKNGANFTGNVDCSRNVMDVAIQYGALELIQELINHGWNIHNAKCGYVGNNSRNQKLTNVWWETLNPSRSRLEELLELFIKNGANPNQIIDNSGGGYFPTPLLLAVEFGSEKAIKILLKAGANVNQIGTPDNRSGKHTPLSYAILLGLNSIAELLISNGAML